MVYMKKEDKAILYYPKSECPHREAMLTDSFTRVGFAVTCKGGHIFSLTEKERLIPLREFFKPSVIKEFNEMGIRVKMNWETA
jgi:hypothetical protein